jgi:hypothetical protein
MQDLFETPISKRKVRNGIYAYQYSNGVININGQKYLEYSLTDAIKAWRKLNPIN